MSKEYFLFFKKKYHIIIIATFVVALFFFIMNLTNGAATSYLDETLNSSFSNYIEPYSSFSELENRINEYKSSPELVEDGVFKIELYTQLLNNKIPYDSATSYIDTTLGAINKHSQFHFYGTFSVIMCIFVILTSCILACLTATTDFLTKTTKLIFTTGVSRNTTMFFKYFSSLSVLLIFDIAVMTIMGLLGLIFKNNGLDYVYFVSGNNILLLNYLQFFFLQLANLILFNITIYTLIFYFALGCKNTIFSLAISLGAFIVSLFIRLDSSRTIIILKQMSTYGILGFCGCDQYFNNLNEICYYLIFIAIAIIAVIFGTLRLNKTDCTR